jgi:hypothetical protein
MCVYSPDRCEVIREEGGRFGLLAFEICLFSPRSSDYLTGNGYFYELCLVFMYKTAQGGKSSVKFSHFYTAFLLLLFFSTVL